ncbi:MAG: L-seryl-tRNA(Sec) selenium transferase [Anaerolineales bacterium]|nr:L-seryl-tRNA(Sec) selenium transferase [Anaerolineales bacterium]
MTQSDLSALPSVDKILKTQTAAEFVAEFGRPLTLEAIRQTLDNVRKRYQENGGTIPSVETILDGAKQLLDGWVKPTLRPVINATGVILHTNLGRAPLSRATIAAMQGVAGGYSTLEYDLEKGRRGSRLLHAEELLTRLTGAEGALVVNNNAAALMLILAALARRRRVLIARTQLVEIGGGFRIPEVMRQSGAKLHEIGATNRVHLSDYQQAIEEYPIALILRAHRSNFRLSGFTGEPSPQELIELASQAGLPMVNDLGSGSLLDTVKFGLDHEPTVQEALEEGADLVCFSGDKLLGGPQAGIIIGRGDLVTKLKKHPMARAVRADKLCLAGLSATLLHYLKDEADREIPIWRMIATTPELLKARAEQWAQKLGFGEVIPGESTVGGGSLPGETLPTYLLALDVPRPDRVLAELRKQQPPVIARTIEDRVVLDARTVLSEQEGALLSGVQNVITPLIKS